MKCYAKTLGGLALIGLLVGCGPEPVKNEGKQPVGGDTSYFFGARIIPGDGSPALEDMSFIVTDGKFTTIGPRKEVVAPKGSARIELTGRTVTPVFINL